MVVYDAATVYADLLTFKCLQFKLTDSGFGFRSNLCWKPSFLEKFGNSLKLRMGIRIADATGMTATSQAAITTAISGGVFTSNADNATLHY
jgi:hypothetical protein